MSLPIVMSAVNECRCLGKYSQVGLLNNMVILFLIFQRTTTQFLIMDLLIPFSTKRVQVLPFLHVQACEHFLLSLSYQKHGRKSLVFSIM